VRIRVKLASGWIVFPEEDWASADVRPQAGDAGGGGNAGESAHSRYTRPACALRFAVVKLWRADILSSPAGELRTVVNTETGELPDLMHVGNFCEAASSKGYFGQHLVELHEISCQLVPTVLNTSAYSGGWRMFMTAAKTTQR
jgi:hypothetical protein